MSAHVCPKCGGPLKWVGRGPGYLNSEQWDAIKPGDYYCDADTCRDSNTRSGFRYYGENDLVVVAPHHNID